MNGRQIFYEHLIIPYSVFLSWYLPWRLLAIKLIKKMVSLSYHVAGRQSTKALNVRMYVDKFNIMEEN
jgi:hypothetical protein